MVCQVKIPIIEIEFYTIQSWLFFVHQIKYWKYQIYSGLCRWHVITSNNEAEIAKIKLQLQLMFNIKDLGQLHYFLGIEVSHFDQGIFLSQRKYRLDIINEHGLLGSKPSLIPIQRNIDWRLDQSDFFARSLHL